MIPITPAFQAVLEKRLVARRLYANRDKLSKWIVEHRNIVQDIDERLHTLSQMERERIRLEGLIKPLMNQITVLDNEVNENQQHNHS